MFLLKFGSKLQNLVIKLQGAMKILTNYRLHFHEVECTGGGGVADAFSPRLLRRACVNDQKEMNNFLF